MDNQIRQQQPSSASSSSSNLVEKQYKLYDIELFKSQLKIFQKAAQPIGASLSQDDLIYDHSQSNSRVLELPLTHQQIQKSNSKAEMDINISIEAPPLEHAQLIQDNKIENKEEAIHIQQVIEHKNLVIQTEQRDNHEQSSRISNPLFLPKQSPTSSELVRQLQILSLERSKCRQSSYFTKKERTVQVKNMEDLFEKYKSSNYQQRQKYPCEENKGTQTSFSKYQPMTHQKEGVMISPNTNDCELCVSAKLKVERHRNNNRSIVTPQLDKMNELQQWMVGAEQRVKKVNYSPAKASQQKYLVSEDKNLYQSQHSQFIFQSQVPLKQEYIAPNKLRDEYLRDAQMRSNEIHRQIEKLRSNPDKITPSRSSSRKKIFQAPSALREAPFIEISNSFSIDKGDATPKTTKNSRNAELSPYRIFSSKVEKDKLSTPTKKQNGSVDFKYVRQNLTSTRIHIFNTKTQQKEKPAQSRSKSKIFMKSPRKPTSPARREIIHDFNLIDLSSQAHEWFRKHEKQILSQAEKIYSYQLITRYIGNSQIQVRLSQFIKGMIEPKRWILLLVDSVYARLKDRYLP